MSEQLHNDDARFLELLNKWQSGDFTRTDERELFDLAAQDPFRQESLDGLLQFPETDHKAVLQKLSDQLQPERKRRVILFPRLLSIAAALALLIAAIWFFTENQPKAIQNDSMARTEEQAPTQPEFSPAPSDKSVPDNQPSLAKTKAKSEDVTSNAIVSEPEPQRDEAGAPPVASAPRPSAQAPDRAEHQVNPGNQGQGNFADLEKSKSSALSKPSEYKSQSTNVADTHERATMEAKKSSAPAAAPATPIQSHADSVVSMLEAGKQAPGAIPTMGWDSFSQYLRSTARLTPAARANNVSGYVRVQFYVDITNRPVNFQVLKSLGYGCDEVAIQLVRDWKWQRQSGQPVVVDVPFIR